MRNAIPYPPGGKGLRFAFWIAACLLTSAITVGKSRPAPHHVTPVDKTVKGKVTDEKGQPLVGVNIVVKGTSTGTVSDTDGKY
jgi:hypothetical protein